MLHLLERLSLLLEDVRFEIHSMEKGGLPCG